MAIVSSFGKNGCDFEILESTVSIREKGHPKFELLCCLSKKSGSKASVKDVNSTLKIPKLNNYNQFRRTHKRFFKTRASCTKFHCRNFGFYKLDMETLVMTISFQKR